MNNEIKDLQNKIQSIFSKYRKHNPAYELEMKAEENPSLLEDTEILSQIQDHAQTSISFNNKEGWENFQIITVGNDFKEFSSFINEIKPVYEALAKVTRIYEDGPLSYFKIMSLDDVTLIGLQPKTDENEFVA